MLRQLTLKGVYKSDQDSIFEDFYLPALSVATRYDRAVGFFSASTLSMAGQALSAFVKNGGLIRLVLGAFSEQEDLEAVKKGYREREVSEKIGLSLLSMISNISDDLFQNRFETLSWLVAYERLEIKIALRLHGMYHDKIGIISDDAGDKVVFSGSANESTHALLPTHNYESINVFRTWVPEHAEYYDPHIESFERLWSNQSPSTAVIDVPTALRDKLVAVAHSLDYRPDPALEAAIVAQLAPRRQVPAESKSGKPHEPAMVNGQPFQMRSHQVTALDAWKSKGDFQGVLALATGAGKTLTAIHAIVKLSEIINGLVCVIAVPYQNLADQWVDILSTFNIYPVRCYVSRVQWEQKLRSTVHDLAMGSRSFAAIVVVNRTLKSQEFQECLSKIRDNRLFWIGDECHHHTSEAYEGFLPAHARYRLGLSATPEHYLDEQRNERLNDFYGEVVSYYSLSQAITDNVLTPYEYFPHIVEFTEEEAEIFVDLSGQIGRMLARQSDLGNNMSTPLAALLMRRARLVGTAANKLPLLHAVLVKQDPTQHTLFYCGDGTAEVDQDVDAELGPVRQGKRQVDEVTSLLHSMSWNVSRFTSRESRKEREAILESFRLGFIDAMVAIRCLDEGIDVPACSTAYILASSKDPRQFVQRRGRILRRSPGKELAVIHDFIVVLPEHFCLEKEAEYAERLIRSELARVAEFSSLSENRSNAYDVLSPILGRYDLEHMI